MVSSDKGWYSRRKGCLVLYGKEEFHAGFSLHGTLLLLFSTGVLGSAERQFVFSRLFGNVYDMVVSDLSLHD